MKFPSFKEYKKDYLIVFTVVLAGLIVVLGQVFSDAATRPFWWKFWNVLQVILGIALGLGWVYLWTSQKKDR